jgi:hypothetical protein
VTGWLLLLVLVLLPLLLRLRGRLLLPLWMILLRLH